MRPNEISYYRAMSTYAKLGQAAEAEALLKEMYINYSTNGNESAKPTLFFYNTVMNCWAKSGQREAGEKSVVLRKTHLKQAETG
jgi:hypothetical protein